MKVRSVTTIPHKSPPKSAAYGVVLFTLLSCVYLLLYRGHPLSIDEISVFDSVESFTQHGTFSRTIEFYRQPSIANDGSPFLPPLYEPLQILAASPFYLFAQATDQFGQFHAVFLLNVVVTALIAVSIYVIALHFGYSRKTAFVGGFLFGTATLALPYSRWLFREPLMSLFALWAFAAAFELRRRMQHRQPVGLPITVLVISVLAMILTKQAGILFVPGIFICLTPPAKFVRRFIPVLAILLAAVLLFLLAIAIINPDFGDSRYDLSRWLNPSNLGLSHMAESALGYQISPARSFWLYSPLLLLGFIGMFRLLKNETRWLVFGIALTFLLTSAAYGALRLGSYWNGGWSWGPRYMLPMVPLWMLFLLPVIESVWNAGRWVKFAFLSVVLFSVSIQVLGIAIPYTDFYNRFYLDAPIETSWLAENWSWQNSAILYHLQNFSLTAFDSAWRYAEPLHVLPLFLIGLSALTLAFGRFVARAVHATPRVVYTVCVAMILLVVLGAVLGLSVLRHDSRYIGSRQDVYELIRQLNADVDRDDAVLLSGSEYMVLFMNWFKAGAYYVALPDDASLPTAAVSLDSPDTFDEAAGSETRNAIDWMFQQSNEIWLVMSPSAYREDHPQRYKRYLSAITFPMEERVISPFAIASRFATGRGTVFGPIEYSQPPLFGDQLALDTVSVPNDLSFNAGDTFSFALKWEPLQPLTDNYHVSIQILDADGILVAQRDTAPQNGYGSTSTWQPGRIYEDRYAVQLPSNLRSGEYYVYVILYELESLERLTVNTGEMDGQTDSLLLTQVRIR